MSKKILYNIIGWYGVVAILVAYLLLSLNYFNADNLLYIILNLTGSVGVVFIAFYKKDQESGFLNLAWALIALFSLIKLIL